MVCNSKLKHRITKMLKENTGVAMCDSGGAYGRSWQRNQTRNFVKEPAMTITCSENEFSVSLSTYHFLAERLEITEESEALQRMYDAFVRPRKDSAYMADMEDFAALLGCRDEDYSGNPRVVNTYNGEYLLDQTLQFLTFTLNLEDSAGGDSYRTFVLLQIHGGCDVRGGYTKPRVFELTSDDYALWDVARATIPLVNGEYLFTDDGYHWYDGGPSEDAKIEPVEGEPTENPKHIKVNGEVREILW